MRGYFINAGARTIGDAEYEYGTIRDKYLPGGSTIGWRFPSGDTLYVDDTALLRPATVAFRVKARPDGQPMMSNGFLTGRDHPDPDKVTTLPPSLTIDELWREIEWLTVDQALEWFRARANEPAVTKTHEGGRTTVHATWQGFLDNLEGRKGYDPREDESLLR